jgi:hypothetical protein
MQIRRLHQDWLRRSFKLLLKRPNDCRQKHSLSDKLLAQLTIVVPDTRVPTARGRQCRRPKVAVAGQDKTVRATRRRAARHRLPAMSGGRGLYGSYR